MSENRYYRNVRTEPKRQESIQAEPLWYDSGASKAWLEERYPLLEDASLGSSLFRYMKACVEDGIYMRGSAPEFLASMLSFQELVRYAGETNFPIVYDRKREKLYPDHGFPERYHVPEPIWSDKHTSRAWLEQRYPLGISALGSPLFRYMTVCREVRDTTSTQMTVLGSMLSNHEWERFLVHYPDSDDHRQDNRSDNILYPEYNQQHWPNPNSGPQDPATAKLFGVGWSHIGSYLQPADQTSMFIESYPPHLRRLSSSDSASSKRKGDDGDDMPPQNPANKRRRQTSDLSGGLMMSAGPPNPSAGRDGLRHQQSLRSMAPPPRPQHKAVSARSNVDATNPDQERKNEEESSSSRRDTVEATRTTPFQTHRSAEERKFSGGLELSSLLTPMQTPGPARQNDQSLEIPKNGGSVQSYFPRKRGFEEVDNEQSSSSSPKKRRASPDSSGDSLLVSRTPKETPLAGTSKQSGNEHVENASLANSPSQFRRTPSISGGDEPPRSSPSTEIPLAAASKKRSIEDMEDALPTISTPKKTRTVLDSDRNHPPPSSHFDPPEQPSSFPLLSLGETSNEDGIGGVIPDSAFLIQESLPHKDPTTVFSISNDIEGPALRSDLESEAIDDGTNPEATSRDDRPTSDMRDQEVGLDRGSETPGYGTNISVPPEPGSHGERHIHLEEDLDGTIPDSEHTRDQTITHVIPNDSDRQEQNAISVVVPLKIPQTEPAEAQELSPDVDTVNTPVAQDKRKGERKPRTKGRKVPQSEPQRKHWKRKSSTKDRESRQQKPKREQQAYVGRLRSGVGKRKHKKPRK